MFQPSKVTPSFSIFSPQNRTNFDLPNRLPNFTCCQVIIGRIFVNGLLDCFFLLLFTIYTMDSLIQDVLSLLFVFQSLYTSPRPYYSSRHHLASNSRHVQLVARS